MKNIINHVKAHKAIYAIGGAVVLTAAGFGYWNSMPVLISRASKKTGLGKDLLKDKTRAELKELIKNGVAATNTSGISTTPPPAQTQAEIIASMPTEVKAVYDSAMVLFNKQKAVTSGGQPLNTTERGQYNNYVAMLRAAGYGFATNGTVSKLVIVVKPITSGTIARVAALPDDLKKMYNDLETIYAPKRAGGMITLANSPDIATQQSTFKAAGYMYFPNTGELTKVTPSVVTNSNTLNTNSGRGFDGL